MSRAEDEADDRWSEGDECVGGIWYPRRRPQPDPTAHIELWAKVQREEWRANYRGIADAWRKAIGDALTDPEKRLP